MKAHKRQERMKTRQSMTKMMRRMNIFCVALGNSVTMEPTYSLIRSTMLSSLVMSGCNTNVPYSCRRRCFRNPAIVVQSPHDPCAPVAMGIYIAYRDSPNAKKRPTDASTDMNEKNPLSFAMRPSDSCLRCTDNNCARTHAPRGRTKNMREC